jgi:ubiquinone/menaquinone biosynthesis C-methylase UbiE
MSDSHDNTHREDDEEQITPLTLEQLYTSTPEGDQLEQDLIRSLNPRSWDMLLEMVRASGLPPAGRIVDVGCGYGHWACQLATRLGASVLAIDIVPAAVAGAREQVKAQGLEDRVLVREASIEQIPAASGTYDAVWCRDMLNHVADLGAALGECARVLRPGGVMLIFQTFAGELLEPREAARLYRALGVVPRNMAQAHVEEAFAAAGFRLLQKDVIASEWREQEVEAGQHSALDALLHAARLLRNRRALTEKYGIARYEQALGDAQWYPFIMLGKLLPIVYLLQKSD